MSPKSVADGLTSMTGLPSPSGLEGARAVASVPSFSCSSVSVDIKAFKGKGAFRSCRGSSLIRWRRQGMP